jgi:hypothetical protein
MNDSPHASPAIHSEILLRPDGRLLVHNLTPAMAALLAELCPDDEALRHRAPSNAAPRSDTTERSHPPTTPSPHSS